MTFPHPETGELLDSREDFMRALADLDDEITARTGSLYNARWAIRDEYTTRFTAAEQPEPRYRTVTQEKVARCPRCGGKLESEEAP